VSRRSHKTLAQINVGMTSNTTWKIGAKRRAVCRTPSFTTSLKDVMFSSGETRADFGHDAVKPTPSFATLPNTPYLPQVIQGMPLDKKLERDAKRREVYRRDAAARPYFWQRLATGRKWTYRMKTDADRRDAVRDAATRRQIWHRLTSGFQRRLKTDAKRRDAHHRNASRRHHICCRSASGCH
jgi:hypothetical protein